MNADCLIEGTGCSAPGCDIKRGWCNLHYSRWQRHGDPLKIVGNPPEPILTAADIPVIRRLYVEGLTYREIAKKFSVHEGTIGYVLRGKTWGWVK